MAKNTITESRIGSLVGSSVGSATTVQAPTSAAQSSAQLGITLTSLYLCRETSGALVDALGGSSLGVVGAPTFQYQVGDQLGVRYPPGASHTADVNGIGIGSGWYGCIFRIADPSLALPGIVSRANVGFTEAVCLYAQLGGSAGWSVQVRDDAAGVAVADGVVKTDAGSWLGQVQIDRANAVVRGRMSRIGGGPSEQISTSIAGFGSVDGAGMVFGFGAHTVFTGGASVAWCATAIGAQCEGEAFMATMANRLGVE